MLCPPLIDMLKTYRPPFLACLVTYSAVRPIKMALVVSILEVVFSVVKGVAAGLWGIRSRDQRPTLISMSGTKP